MNTENEYIKTAEDFDQVVPFCDHAYGTLTPEQVEKLSADVDQFCPF